MMKRNGEDGTSSSAQSRIDDERAQFRSSRLRSTLPERVIFLMDLHEEMSEQWNDNFGNRMAAIKDAIGKFVRRKNNSPLKHQFALASYKSQEEVSLVVNFTFNQDEIATGLEGISPETSHWRDNQGVDLGTILWTLCDLLNLSTELKFCQSTDNINGNSTRSSCSPEYLTRCILVYGRSREVPIDSSKKYLSSPGDAPASRIRGEFTATSPYIPLLHHPHCYVDILYLHLRANEERVHCQIIYDRLSRLARCSHPFGDSGEVSNLEPFVLETHASAIKLGSHMAALLAHPAQREKSSTLNCRMDMNSLLAESVRKLILDDQISRKI